MKNNTENEFAFEKENYMWLIGGLVLIIIGFLLMVGGGSDNPNEFNEAELFSARRITVAPLVVLAGYVTVLIAIMKKPKASK
ncbi:MAG TPA: DUF3098 domain-containing protein [Luteibaculaceae bacterium]|nr:DUF3098 domain-containing protein [Luteibaculaceae bacterium]